MIVGPGRAGLAVGYALAQSDAVDRLTVCGRRPEPPAHPLFVQGLARYVFGLPEPDADTQAIFLAVPDGAVPEMAHAVAARGPSQGNGAAFHLSGALSTEVLAPLHAAGYAVGSFHPLQALAHPVTGAERLPGSWIAVTGEPQAVAVGRRLAAAMGCSVLTVAESRRPLYHAAAVMASNFLPPLLDAATRMLERAGLAPEEAFAALLPLVRGTLDNIEERGLAPAITGPIPRGDTETVGLHLRAMDPEDRRLYAFLGLALARMAGEELDEDTRRVFLERFTEETS